MNHTVTISIAPVIAILDDEADLLNMVAIPLTIVLWLPCWLFAFWGNFHTWLYRTGYALSDYRRGWTADLELMILAARFIWRDWAPLRAALRPLRSVVRSVAGCSAWSIGAG